MRNTQKAQVSLEFIIIFAIALSFLIMVLPAVLSAQRSAQAELHSFYLRKMADDIEYTSNTLCIMGEGNERAVSIVSDSDMNITSTALPGRSFTITDGSARIARGVKCSTNISAQLKKGSTEIILKNENEIIVLK